MSDDRIVEVIAEALREGESGAKRPASLVLTALRSKGWELYRPDECATTFLEDRAASDRGVEPGAYHLVLLGRL